MLSLGPYLLSAAWRRVVELILTNTDEECPELRLRRPFIVALLPFPPGDQGPTITPVAQAQGQPAGRASAVAPLGATRRQPFPSRRTQP